VVHLRPPQNVLDEARGVRLLEPVDGVPDEVDLPASRFEQGKDRERLEHLAGEHDAPDVGVFR